MILTPRFFWLAVSVSLAVVLVPQLWWLWALVLVGLIGVDMFLAGSPRAIQVQRIPTAPVRSGQSTTAATQLTFTGSRRLRGSIRDGWQPTAGAVETGPHRVVQEVRIAPGESVIVETALHPRRRGDLVSEHVSIRSLGPMGLAGRQVTHRVPHTLRVLPEFRSRRHLPSKLQRLRELDGATAIQRRGAGTEFDSLRDYVRGDDVRSIDWRATARRQDAAGQHLVVRTWRPERDRRVILCVDASRTSAARVGDAPRLDSAMESALLLGALAESAGDRVDCLAFQRDVVARASSTQPGRFLNRLAETLAPVEPVLVEADWSRLSAQVAAVSRQRALVVVLSTLDSASLQEGLLPVLPGLAASHRVVVAAVQDPALLQRADSRQNASEVYGAAAAERTLLEHQAVAAELSSLGAEVVQAPPEDLPPALADCYIRLKATGRL